MPPRLKPSIAQLVKAELARQKISQRGLAREIGCSASDLNQWLLGKAGFRVLFAERAMAYLGIKATPPEPLEATGRSPNAKTQRTRRRKAP